MVARPAILEHVTTEVTARRAGLEDAKMAAAAAISSPAATYRSWLDRIQKFLRLA